MPSYELGYAIWTDSKLYRTSKSGVLLAFAGSTAAWEEMREANVALLSDDAEYMVLSGAELQIVRILSIHGFVHPGIRHKTVVNGDNKGTIEIADNKIVNNKEGSLTSSIA